MSNDDDSTKSTVSIDRDALDKFARDITQSILDNESLEVTEWDADGWHYTGTNYETKGLDDDGKDDNDDDDYYELMRMERVALYVLTLDAMNFCFWPLSSETEKSDSDADASNGLEYEHLAVALRKVAEADDDGETNARRLPDHRKHEGVVVDDVDDDDDDTASTNVRAASSYALSPANLASLTPPELRAMLHPHFPQSVNKRDSENCVSSSSSSATVYYELPNLHVRCRLLNELGTGLQRHHDGSALRMISKADRSADASVGILLDSFPGFRDFVDTEEWDDTATTATTTTTTAAAAAGGGAATAEEDVVSPLSREWESAKSSSTVIHFYKRAQIAIADIWAALGRRRGGSTTTMNTATTTKNNESLRNCCRFKDMDLVTTFPDYRVPQILRHVNVMQYTSELANLVDGKVELEKGGADEVSIRAGTVVAVEEIVRKVKELILSNDSDDDDGGGGRSSRSEDDLRKLAKDVSAVTVDWYLWQRGEKLDRANLLEPHHRVRTTFY